MQMDCYIVVFVDQQSAWHFVPFTKADDGNRNANELLETLKTIGLQAEKFGPYSQRP